MLLAFGDLQTLYDGPVRVVQDVKRDEDPYEKNDSGEREKVSRS